MPVLISSRLDDDFLVGMIYPEIQAATPAAVALDFMYYNFARMHRRFASRRQWKRGYQIMSGVLKTSLASWREAHGFGILNIIGPRGESFFVETRPAATVSDTDAWADMTELQLRTFLAERGLSDADAEEAIRLSRQWATTVTGYTVFPATKNSN